MTPSERGADAALLSRAAYIDRLFREQFTQGTREWVGLATTAAPENGALVRDLCDQVGVLDIVVALIVVREACGLTGFGNA